MPKPPMGKHRDVGSLPGRAKSVHSKASKPQVRVLKERTCPSFEGHKSRSETALVADFKNMRLGHTRSGARKMPTSTQCASSLEDIAKYIMKKKVKNIVVMTGAGISTPSGIPDFRSPGTGLYDNLRQYQIPYPEAVFDVDYFEGNPKPFYTLAKELYPSGKYQPNYIHYFLKLLDQKGLLLRVYTQNIDGLERMCGIPAQRLVEAHGSFLTASCVKCRQSRCPQDIKKAVYTDQIPRCKKSGCLGLVKPDIVFFGEDLPKRFYYYLRDFPQADLLLVMGTSLEVEPFAGLVDSIRFCMPRILINHKAVGPFKRKRRANDIAIEGDIIEKLHILVECLGWRMEMQQLLDGSKSQVEEYLTENNLFVEPDAISSNVTPGTSSSSPSTANDSTAGSRPVIQAAVTQIGHDSGCPSAIVKSTASSSSKLIPPAGHQRLLDSRRLASNRTFPATGTRLPHAKSGQNGLPSKAWLPRIKSAYGAKPPAFHAQRDLYRTAVTYDSDSSSSSSDESSAQESSDD